MPRSERLIQLMQLLRTMPQPVRARDLAQELQVSLRSTYRDIESLRAMGAVIDGEAGFGYSLVEDPALPPMMFSTDEMEALILGLREVAQIADPVLVDAASNALAKLRACLPEPMRLQTEHSFLHEKRFAKRPEISIYMPALRQAMRDEYIVKISYIDQYDRQSQRRLLPLSIIYMENALMLAGWCELRRDFRAFRIDRITDLNVLDESFRPRRVPLMRDCAAHFRAQIDAKQ